MNVALDLLFNWTPIVFAFQSLKFRMPGRSSSEKRISKEMVNLLKEPPPGCAASMKVKSIWTAEKFFTTPFFPGQVCFWMGGHCGGSPCFSLSGIFSSLYSFHPMTNTILTLHQTSQNKNQFDMALSISKKFVSMPFLPLKVFSFREAPSSWTSPSQEVLRFIHIL